MHPLCRNTKLLHTVRCGVPTPRTFRQSRWNTLARGFPTQFNIRFGMNRVAPQSRNHTAKSNSHADRSLDSHGARWGTRPVVLISTIHAQRSLNIAIRTRTKRARYRRHRANLREQRCLIAGFVHLIPRLNNVKKKYTLNPITVNRISWSETQSPPGSNTLRSVQSPELSDSLSQYRISCRAELR
jgi:hypothetical protein